MGPLLTVPYILKPCVLIKTTLSFSKFPGSEGCNCRRSLRSLRLNTARLLSVRNFKTRVDDGLASPVVPRKAVFDASCDPSDGHDHNHDKGAIDTETAHEWVSFKGLECLSD